MSHQEPNGPNTRFTSRSRVRLGRKRKAAAWWTTPYSPPGPAQPRVRLPVRRRCRGRAEHQLPATDEQLHACPGLAQQSRALLRRLTGAHHDHVPTRELREIGVVGAVRDEPLGYERRQRLGNVREPVHAAGDHHGRGPQFLARVELEVEAVGLPVDAEHPDVLDLGHQLLGEPPPVPYEQLDRHLVVSGQPGLPRRPAVVVQREPALRRGQHRRARR